MYQAYTDYHGMMDLIEDMYRTLAKKICGKDIISYQGTDIRLGEPWERLTMAEAVKKYAGVDYNDWATDADARACAKEKGVEVEEGENATKGHVLIAFFDAFVEEQLIQPTIIYDYPVENSRWQSGSRKIRRSQSVSSTSSMPAKWVTHSPN